MVIDYAAQPYRIPAKEALSEGLLAAPWGGNSHVWSRVIQPPLSTFCTENHYSNTPSGA